MTNLVHQPESTELHLPLDQNPAAVYLASLGASSRRTMRGSLDTIAQLVTNGQQNAVEFQWSKLRYQHTTAIRSALQERYAPATANKTLAALRRVLQEAWRLGQLTAEEYQRAADLPTIKGETLPAGRALQSSEISALLKTCSEGSIVDLRDAAMLGILRVGLRRSEVVKLDVQDFDPAEGGLLVQGGKGRKDRQCYLPEQAIALVQSWLQVRGSEPGPLLRPISTSSRILSRRLTDQAVLYILQKRSRQANISDCKPHDMRRTFASDLLDAGVDISTVSKLMGHSSPNTTARYDKRGEAAKRKAVNALKL